MEFLTISNPGTPPRLSYDTCQSRIKVSEYILSSSSVVKGRAGVLDTRWFYYWFRSHCGVQLINSLSRGAVRERILFNRLSKGKIDLPDFETQKGASVRMKETTKVVGVISRQLDAINALPAAILRRAFSGGI